MYFYPRWLTKPTQDNQTSNTSANTRLEEILVVYRKIDKDSKECCQVFGKNSDGAIIKITHDAETYKITYETGPIKKPSITDRIAAFFSNDEKFKEEIKQINKDYINLVEEIMDYQDMNLKENKKIIDIKKKGMVVSTKIDEQMISTGHFRYLNGYKTERITASSLDGLKEKAICLGANALYFYEQTQPTITVFGVEIPSHIRTIHSAYPGIYSDTTNVRPIKKR